MSNEMISVPREQLQRWLDDIGNSRHVTEYAARKREELRALLAKPAEQPQGEPVVFVDASELRNLKVSGFESFSALLYRDQAGMLSPRRVALYTRPAEQPAPDSALKDFANEMINAAFEGGGFEGGDIQDIAVKHGLLRIEQREEECGEVCACRSEGYGFPAECYRRTALLRGEQPAPVAVAPERPAHASPPQGTQPSGTHRDNDGLDARRKPGDKP